MSCHHALVQRAYRATLLSMNSNLSEEVWFSHEKYLYFKWIFRLDAVCRSRLSLRLCMRVFTILLCIWTANLIKFMPIAPCTSQNFRCLRAIYMSTCLTFDGNFSLSCCLYAVVCCYLYNVLCLLYSSPCAVHSEMLKFKFAMLRKQIDAE